MKETREFDTFPNEKQLVEDSRTQIAAEGDGVVEYVDATTIRILYDRNEDEEFVSFEPVCPNIGLISYLYPGNMNSFSCF